MPDDSRREEAIRAVKNFIESVYITAEPLAEQDAAEIVGRVLAFFSLPDPEKDRLRAIEKAARGWLAWELARMGRYSSADDNSVRVAVDLSVETIYGAGRTTTDAIRDLAVALDRWAMRVGGNGLSEPSPSSGESEGQA